jgi:hypothetical protein
MVPTDIEDSLFPDELPELEDEESFDDLRDAQRQLGF